MKPRERRETGEQDLFRSRLDQIIDLKHPLVALGRTVDWGFLEREFGAVYTDDPGRPPLPTRLMAGLAILKHTYDLSDEVLCERWVENPYYQYFCGEEFFQHRLVFDRSSLTRWRNRMGEERLAARITRRRRNLHVVYISNFKCGPDSYIKSFMNDAAGKPGLVLQFDGHSNDAGFITRCEAYLDSKGFLRCSATAT